MELDVRIWTINYKVVRRWIYLECGIEVFPFVASYLCDPAAGKKEADRRKHKSQNWMPDSHDNKT